MYEETYISPSTPNGNSWRSPPKRSPGERFAEPGNGVPLAAFIFPDYRALYSLKLQESRDLCYNEITLFGFEVYIVEQWALERKYSALMTSYTGNLQDIVHAVKVALPELPELWPQPFKEYYKELIAVSTPKHTEDGTLFISTSSQIPSTLNLLHVECGDLRKIWSVFKVNVDLKRLQCGGRSALLLCEPSSASWDKFAQLYKIHMPSKGSQDLDASSLTYAVVRLISIAQTCLTYFDLLDPRYKDGMLCMCTEKAAHKWWSAYGMHYLGMERPKHEGPLGPTTVAGIISLVLTAFFKLMLEDCVSIKDPFDEDGFHAAVWNFQKKYSLGKSLTQTHQPCLDVIVLGKLFEVTSKTSNSDIFKIKKVVKSTVQDIKGKSNALQISNCPLTTDLEVLAKSVQVGDLSLLWKGKGGRRISTKKRCEPEFDTISFNHGSANDEILKSNLGFVKSPEGWLQSVDKRYEKNYETSPYGASEHFSESIPSVEHDQAARMNEEEKERSHSDKLFHAEIERRASVPYLLKDVAALQLDYENLPHKVSNLDSMQRRHSVSVIQDAIESWSLPFEPSVVKMARDLLRMEKDFQWSNGQASQTTSTDPQGFEIPLSRLQENYNNLHLKLQVLEQSRAVLGSKHSRLLADISELDSLVSKFRYDIRILDRRMRDVEDRVSQYGSKLASLVKAMENKQTSHLISSERFSNPSDLDRCAKEYLKNGHCRYNGILLNIWWRLVPVSFREDSQKVWLYLTGKIFSNALFPRDSSK
ncbi:LAMI_0E01266g1_1 [Lachancea mirantina]|uniref:LAMI_0E01266g1_1 n=1 Tax=Lachancea mirantina TaxID=1230905 RepID=A0A1G4JIK5_9SACH|nr:LAMI_0E01266g1_1 [Lachancea mirantina]